MATTSNYKVIAGIVLALVLSGCGGSSQGPLIPFSQGLWEISGTSTSNPSLNFDLAGSLMQNGASVSGIQHFRSSACFPFSTDIPASGKLTDTQLDLTLSLPGGQKITLSNLIHPGGHPQFLNGPYTVSGPGCMAADQGNGGLSAQAFTASWIGTLTSSTGAKANMMLQLTQTGPDAHGLFSATGSATITGGTCFSAATIDPSTVLLGKGSTLVLDNSVAGTSGKTVLSGDFFPASNVGFGSFNGTYTSTQGTCSENGAASLSE